MTWWLLLSLLPLVIMCLSEPLVRRRRRSIAAAGWLDTARRESWDLGLPFPETDGTLSRSAPVTALPEPKRPSAEQIHAGLHARRWAAESRSVLTDEAIRRGAKASVAESMTKTELLRFLSLAAPAAQWNDYIRDGFAQTAAVYRPPTFLMCQRVDPDRGPYVVLPQGEVVSLSEIESIVAETLGESD